MLCSCISLPVNIEQSLAVATVPAESYILLAKLAPRFLCSFVQGLFDLMSKFLTKRMIMTRPRSGKVCLASSDLQSATFKLNIRFSNVASELLIWVSQAARREPDVSV